MYRISNDARAKRSAESICKGLEECLKEKPLNKIKINDIYEKSGVSRASFYRLFDRIEDVFAYECDAIFKDILLLLHTQKFSSKNEEALYCTNRWLMHEPLIKAVVENNLSGIFYDSHMRNVDLLKRFYQVPFNDENSYDYFVYIIASLSFASLSMYFQHGANESIEEVYKTICRCTSVIAETMARDMDNNERDQK